MRYILDPNDDWKIDTEWCAGLPESETLGIEVNTRNLADSRGHVYRDGAYRVFGGGPTKVFKGETAWSDAERTALDRLFAARYAR